MNPNRLRYRRDLVCLTHFPVPLQKIHYFFGETTQVVGFGIYLCRMNHNMGRLIRYILIIHKLQGRMKYVPADELISYLELQMEMRGYEVGISVRTLQRDIREIAEMFDIEIKNYRGLGYYISDRVKDTDVKYEELLMNFDLLTSINADSQPTGFILPEHHRPKGSDLIPALIRAIKDSSVVSFDYRLVRKGNKLVHKVVKPYFLKESLDLWYLLAMDDRERLVTYGIDRISGLEITDEDFRRDETVNPDELFRHSYGIWDDPAIPVEEIELRYSALDGAFLKANPLHGSQEILVDTEDEFRIRLRLRITNDFVMALLSRSASLTVIKPLSLRERIRDVYAAALERNN